MELRIRATPHVTNLKTLPVRWTLLARLCVSADYPYRCGFVLSETCPAVSLAISYNAQAYSLVDVTILYHWNVAVHDIHPTQYSA
jgi:hypothetical protein